jgi:hypothetical protein
MLLTALAWCFAESIEVCRKVGRVLRWIREVSKAPEFVDLSDKDRRQRLFGGFEE